MNTILHDILTFILGIISGVIGNHLYYRFVKHRKSQYMSLDLDKDNIFISAKLPTSAFTKNTLTFIGDSMKKIDK